MWPQHFKKKLDRHAEPGGIEGIFVGNAAFREFMALYVPQKPVEKRFKDLFPGNICRAFHL